MTKLLKVETVGDVRAALATLRKRLKTHRHTTLLMQGPIGTGKVMLARRIAYLVPKPKGKDLENLSWIYVRLRWSAEDIAKSGTFRAPHHTISEAGMLGSIQRNGLYPGELSLAHAGTLLLDEIEEFRAQTIRDTFSVLKHGEIILSSRAGEEYNRVIVPADPRLVIMTAMACACGKYPGSGCVCDGRMVARHTEHLDRLLSGINIDYVLAISMTTEARESLGKYKRWRDD